LRRGSAIRPALRADGIGSALLQRAVDELRTRGGEEMHINVDEVDVDTRRFYERHGFANTEAGTDDRMLLYTAQVTPDIRPA
jgi:GNAT superfamily N-acetyltransferase